MGKHDSKAIGAERTAPEDRPADLLHGLVRVEGDATSAIEEAGGIVRMPTRHSARHDLPPKKAA